MASIFILLHYRQLIREAKGFDASLSCWPYGQQLLVVGIVRWESACTWQARLEHHLLTAYSNYAAVAADTFSSELGILSKSKPRLITSWNLRQVPPGTNGGVTVTGTLAGFFGALTIALTSAILLPFCTPRSAGAVAYGIGLPGLSGGSVWGWQEKCLWIVAITLWGGLGSLLDSFLGGWLQASVVDARTGKVIEGSGGKKVGSRQELY